ncbi:MAG: LPS export ABC transporter permease LptF [Pseudomonadales bacterium]
MIIHRYISNEILGTLTSSMGLLLLIYAAFSAATILADAVAGTVGAEFVGRLVLLRSIIAAEVILPTALYLSVVWTFCRMDRDAELMILRASGVGELRALYSVIAIAVVMSGVTAGLSLEARPWAYRSTYALKEAASDVDVDAMEAGRFYRVGDRVVVADRVNADDRSLEGAVIFERAGGDFRFIYGESAHLPPADESGSRLVEFDRGYAVEVTELADADRSQKFEHLRVRVAAIAPEQSVRSKPRALSLNDLRASLDPKSVAELQWRICLPALVLMMTLIGARIGQGRPRESINPRLTTALLLYVIMFALAAAARTWVENGDVPAFPGMWWTLTMPPMLGLALWFWRWARR